MGLRPCQEQTILSPAPLHGSDVVEVLVPVFMVVPSDEGSYVRAGLLLVVLALRGIVMAGFEGTEQALGVGVVMADAGTGEGGGDAEVGQGRQHLRGLHHRPVV